MGKPVIKIKNWAIIEPIMIDCSEPDGEKYGYSILSHYIHDDLSICWNTYNDSGNNSSNDFNKGNRIVSSTIIGLNNGYIETQDTLYEVGSMCPKYEEWYSVMNRSELVELKTKLKVSDFD